MGLLKQQIFSSETPATAGTHTTYRFKLPKVGSLLSGSQSAVIVDFRQTGGIGQQIALTGLLNCLSRMNIYIGSHRVCSIQEAGKYLNHKLRTSMTADEMVDKATYMYGVNDITSLTQTFLNATGDRVVTSNLVGIAQPSLQIFATAALRASYELQLPLSFLFDLLESDFPVYMLGSSDLFLELDFDLTVLKNVMNVTAGLATSLIIQNAFIYGVYYQMPLESLQRNMAIPFTDVFYTSSLITTTTNFTQSFSLNGQKLKRLFILADKTDAPSYRNLLGDYQSQFIDSSGAYLQLQVKYLDEQYFTENIVCDTELFNYTNDCGKYGFVCQVGQFTSSDGTGYLSSTNFSTLIAQNYRTRVSGGLNMVMLNFGKVPYSHPLIDLPEMKTVTIDNHPIQILLRVQDSANNINNINLNTHAELHKQLVLGIGSALTVN
jgi:hypothetical protein